MWEHSFVESIETEPEVGLFVKKTVEKIGGKLCRTCCPVKNQGECMCTDQEIELLKKTWTTIQKMKAIENGYTIKHISEVYHWVKV